MANYPHLDNHRPFFSDMLSATGRLRRRFFCLYWLIYIVAGILINVVSFMLIFLSPNIGMLITLMLFIPIFSIMICQAIRRYHDFGMSGLIPGLYCLVFITFGVLNNMPGSPLLDEQYAGAVLVAGLIISALGLIIMVFVPALVPGQRGINRYGSNPRYPLTEQQD